MTKDEALQKIKKCLALASSPNAHEAAAAMRQAQKLMQLFDVSEQDISLSDVAECAQQAQNVPHVRWESALSNMVAQAFGCLVLTTVGVQFLPGMKARRMRKWVFIGVGAAPEVAGYAFDVLSRQCAKDRRAYIKKQPKNCKAKTKVARGDAYAEGWLAGVYDELESFASTPAQQQLVARYMEAKYPDTKESKAKDRISGKNITCNDRYLGMKAGSAARLKHGVGGQQQALLLAQQ